uniref:uncharacterized protein LOC104265364 isoform X2 n=1 Tax=Ciona intestinalis TaxID=7719 RepID=UPI000EF4E6F8|nr:uncharacterized protein LOC104265364 isoform X2 [Ciona intestinalis]|eukprot:XP_009857479.2 uncharacterized protein LOC104265364 isoform X2 [Ciona intestinalis]
MSAENDGNSQPQEPGRWLRPTVRYNTVREIEKTMSVNSATETTGANLGPQKLLKSSDDTRNVRHSFMQLEMRARTTSDIRPLARSGLNIGLETSVRTSCYKKRDDTEFRRSATFGNITGTNTNRKEGLYAFTESQSVQRINAGRSLRNYCYTTVFPDASYELRQCSSTSSVSNVRRVLKHKNDEESSAVSANSNPGKSCKSNLSKNDSVSACSVGLEIAPTWLWKVRMRAVKKLAISFAFYVMHWLPVHIIRINSARSSSNADKTWYVYIYENWPQNESHNTIHC